ncbi:MAG: hypothetical protein IKX59_01490 [Bacteroidales bacterium]|nr:hypothetical protein [Bacteroidales bacterium]
METRFNYITLSVFLGCNTDVFCSAIKELYKDRIEKSIVELHASSLAIEQYYDPLPGAHYEKFSFWTKKNCPNIVFFSSNKEDGMDSLCRCTRNIIGCELVSCCLSPNLTSEANPMNSFLFISKNGSERLIMSYYDYDRWAFFIKGEPLRFENTDYYKRRKIKDRINMDIIKEYLSELDIVFSDIDMDISNCMTFNRLSWG